MVVLCLLGLSVMLNAGQNKFGVADTRQISFTDPIRIGGTLVPKGSYTVLHTMQGEEHIMVFTQEKGRNPVEVKVKCTLVPLGAKADQTQAVWVLNAANERVLRELIFRGDTAKHVF